MSIAGSDAMQTFCETQACANLFIKTGWRLWEVRTQSQRKIKNVLCVMYHRYQEVLLSLARQILQNLQFRYNQSRLDELDDEVLDDDVG